MNDVLNDSTGGSWITANHIGQRILSRTFDDPFRLELMLKDVTIAVRAGQQARASNCRTQTTANGVYRAADEHAGTGKSLSELARWVEHSTGVDIIPGSVGRR